MINHQPERDRQREQGARYQAEEAYRRGLRQGLESIREIELAAERQARKRTGITEVARLYGRREQEIDPAFSQAMQRLWDIARIDDSGRADLELRRAYHLVAKGKAPLTESDVIKLARMREEDLRKILPWLAHRLSLVEAIDHVDLGEAASPVIVMEEARG
jgi:hypothetical protein